MSPRRREVAGVGAVHAAARVAQSVGAVHAAARVAESVGAVHAGRPMKRGRDDATPAPLAGRVLLVTGAGGGIGRAACVELARRGARVFACDISAESSLETVRQVKAAVGDEAVVSQGECDVADESAAERMVALAVAAYGRLDGAVNAAGIEGMRARLHETPSSNFDKVLGVNLKGVFNCMRAEIAQMLKQPPPPSDGSTKKARAPIDERNYCIVNVSSTAGLSAMPEFSCYSASKHAIQGLTKSAAREYAADGIRVCSVCPSTTDTPMVQRFAEQWPEWQAKQNASFPVGRIGSAEEVARAIAFLFSSDCPMMTGTSITIDGAASA